MSVHYSRDEREFDIHNYNLLKSLNFKKEKFIKRSNKSIKKISGYQQYFNSFKETKYLPNRKLPFIIFLDILKFGIQLTDILYPLLIGKTLFQYHFRSLFLFDLQ